MTPAQINLVRNTADAFQVAGDRIAHVFYERLFELAPETRRMFPIDLTAQKRKIRDTLSALVEHVFEMDRVLGHLRWLGGLHIVYGATPDHYVVVGEALLYSLHEVLGAQFTPELEQAWASLYAEVTRAMTSGLPGERMFG